MRPLMLSTAPASSRRSTMKASAPVRRMVAEVCAGGAVAPSSACAPWRSPGGASSSVASWPLCSRVTRSQAIADDPRPADRVADAIELLTMRLEVLDHRVAAGAVQPDAPQAQSLGHATIRRRGGIEDVARRDDAVGIERIERAPGDAAILRLERGDGNLAARRDADRCTHAVRGQCHDEKHEAELEREPKAARGGHGRGLAHTAGA